MDRPALVIDLDDAATTALVVAGTASWAVPDPASGAERWPTSVPIDGERVTEFLGGVRAAAQRQHGQIDRVVLTIPAAYQPGDPRRARLVAAAEAAGFGAVELLPRGIAAVCAAHAARPFGRGDLVLVHDLGAGFEASVVQVGDDFAGVTGGGVSHDLLGSAALPAPLSSQTGLDQSLAADVDLLMRLGLAQHGVTWVLPIGAGATTPGLDSLLERGLGAPVRRLDAPEVAVARGAAVWLPRSGARQVLPTPAGAERIMPLSYTLPGGSGQLLRWLVAVQQPFGEGQPLARVRLADGTLWDLTSRGRGVLDQVIVADGSPIHSGDWLALTRQ